MEKAGQAAALEGVPRDLNSYGGRMGRGRGEGGVTEAKKA